MIIATSATIWQQLMIKCLLQDAKAEEAPSAAALNPNEWRSFKVVSKEPVTHNTSRLRYESSSTPNQGMHAVKTLA